MDQPLVESGSPSPAACSAGKYPLTVSEALTEDWSIRIPDTVTPAKDNFSRLALFLENIVSELSELSAIDWHHSQQLEWETGVPFGILRWKVGSLWYWYRQALIVVYVF